MLLVGGELLRADLDTRHRKLLLLCHKWFLLLIYIHLSFLLSEYGHVRRAYLLKGVAAGFG